MLIDTIEWRSHSQQSEILFHKFISISNIESVCSLKSRIENVKFQQRQVSSENYIDSHSINDSSNSYMKVSSTKILEKSKNQRYFAESETADSFEHDDEVKNNDDILNEMSKKSFSTSEIMIEHCESETLNNNNHAHDILRI